MIRSNQIAILNKYLVLLVLIIIINLNIMSFNPLLVESGKSTISESSIEWEYYKNDGQFGVITLTPSDPSLTIPVEVDLPLYSLFEITINPHPDPDMALYGLPLKYTYSGLQPSDDFKLVSNITKDDAVNAGENKVWLKYQRINNTAENLSITLTLTEDYSKTLQLHIFILTNNIAFSLTDDNLIFHSEGNFGYGKNQTFILGFYVNSNSTGSIDVKMRNYNTTSRNSFNVNPGDYVEITARTISNVTIDPEISSDSFKEAFNITITCELSKKVSGIIIFYPIRPYYYLKQIDIESATFWLFPNLLVSLCFVLVIRKGKKTNKRNVNY